MEYFRVVIKLLWIPFLVLFTTVNGQTCNSDNLFTDFSMDNCIAQQTTSTFYYTVDDDTCLPYCEAYDEKGYFRKKCPCVPGYQCEYRCSGGNDEAKVKCDPNNDDCSKKFTVRSICAKTCVDNDESCMAYHANTSEFRNTKFSAQYFKPACQNDGYWKAKQCKGGVSGKCICYDKIGTRLFGEAVYSKSKDMTCACSRRRQELMDEGKAYVTLHCNSLGNYESLQCDSGLCWCVEEKTGDLISAVVPEKAMNKLSCHNITSVGSQYLRQCDSIKYAMAQITKTFNKHGVTYVNLGVRLCDGDGAYGVYNVSDGLAYCTLRDGTKISAYQSDSSTNIKSLNCRCARDSVLYKHAMTCNGNGNYREYQTVIIDNDDYTYCVDSDGFQKTDLSSETIDNCTSYY